MQTLKFVLGFVFCFISGTLFGSGKYIFSIFAIAITVFYIMRVFKTTHIQSKLSKRIEDAVNYSHFD